jgi:tetratricopeptide (TPR) repeat protein
MRRIIYISCLSIVCQIHSATAQSAHKSLREADQYYQNEDYASAELLYRKAHEKDPNLKSNFNLGNTLYKQERFEEAIEKYQMAVQRAKTPDESSIAYFNLGNAYFNHQDIEQAISAFKKSILENPNNKEAQYNLIVCKELLKVKQHEKKCNNPQPSEDGEQSEDQKDSEKQDQQDKQDSEQEKKEGQDEQKDKNEEEDQSESEESQEEKIDSSQIQDSEGAAFDSSRLEKQTLDSIDAAKLLQVIESEEQKVQERLRKFNSTRKKQDKDW